MKHFIIAAEIYLAGGCFWGTEHFLKQIRGVESTEVGYANSIINQPTYQQVCSGETNAAETVKVVYDPETVNLSLLLDLYFKTIDPTSLNRQEQSSRNFLRLLRNIFFLIMVLVIVGNLKRE